MGNLVLTRKPAHSIIIGDDVKLTVRSISGNRVSVSVDAPEGVRVRRGEALTEKQENAK